MQLKMKINPEKKKSSRKHIYIYIDLLKDQNYYNWL